MKKKNTPYGFYEYVRKEKKQKSRLVELGLVKLHGLVGFYT